MNIPYVFKRCGKCGEWLVASKVNFHKKKTCKYGLNTMCKQCRLKQEKQYYLNNKENILKRNKKYYLNNKEKVSIRNKKYKQEHEEQTKEYKKQWYTENKEYLIKKQRQYYQDNKECCKERNKQWYQNNIEHYKKYKKQYKEEHKEYYKEYYKKRYQDNKEYMKEYMKEHYKKYSKTLQGQVAIFNSSSRRRMREQNQGNGITKDQWLEMMKYFNWKCAYSGECIGYKNKRSIDHIKPLSKGGEHEIWNVIPMDRGLNSSKNNKDLLEWYKEQPFFSEDRLQKIYEWQEYAFNKWHKEEIV